MSDPLYAPRTVRSLLADYGLHADKRLGQNFLIDGNLVELVVRSLAPGPGDRVYEVGTGLGTLTQALAKTEARVLSIEKDTRLAPVLEHTLEGTGVELVFTDALSYPWRQVPEGSLFIGNLPYNIATPLLTMLLISGRFSRLVALVQKEVAERLRALPSTAAYGILSLRIQYHAEVKKVRDFPPSVFLPKPKVTSTLVWLKTRKVQDNAELFTLIQTAFANRRKSLRKNLENAGYSRKQAIEALNALEINPQVRGEALSLDTFLALEARLRTGKTQS